MASPKTHRFAIYRPDYSDDEKPSAFVAADLLDYPPERWWRKVNPPRKPGRGATPPAPPTRAAYWRNRSPSRLLKPTELPGESKASAKRRVGLARSYFASLAAFERKRTRGNRAGGNAEWRVALIGSVAMRSDSGPFDELAHGRQFSPWQRVARGTLVADVTIRQQYLQTCRRAVALSPKQHAPEWDKSLGTFDERIGYNDSERGVIFPERKDGSRSGVWIEFRLVG